jgi:TRAP-type C4-dicarboxylate transport system permease small subunit
MWKINKWVLSLCKTGMIVIVPTMTIMVFVQVILRYGFHNSLSWVDELARYLLVWLTCLGSVYASEKGMHVSVEVFRSRLKGKMQVALIIIIHIAVLIFFLIGAWQGTLYAISGWIQRSASLNLHMTVIYAAIPVSFGLMVLTQTECFVNEVKLALQGKPPERETQPSEK